ncbi:hypothetical protein EYF80_023552 [Liparis tanakae]|uniref:Uncharacterized protein n=1 Tax=Liparis tanakae TaxID=230148 RepID=A0A4Z2HML3_9TELE|nr:hypothetical protein EYF80_023552 [Liparis tanakae]
MAPELQEDESQQQLKLSTRQQDSGPEVSGVTCHAKEITACRRLPKAGVVSGHWPAEHGRQQWCRDITGIWEASRAPARTPEYKMPERCFEKSSKLRDKLVSKRRETSCAGPNYFCSKITRLRPFSGFKCRA